MQPQKRHNKERTMAKKETPNVLTAAVVKRTLKESDVNVSADFIPALNESVLSQMTAAVRRAKANGRKTVRADDL